MIRYFKPRRPGRRFSLDLIRGRLRVSLFHYTRRKFLFFPFRESVWMGGNYTESSVGFELRLGYVELFVVIDTSKRGSGGDAGMPVAYA